MQQNDKGQQSLKSHESDKTMKKPVLVGIAIVVVILGVIVYSTMNLAAHSVEACMTFKGVTNCRKASGTTVDFATRAAIQNACATIASGVTDSIACEQSQPAKLTIIR